MEERRGKAPAQDDKIINFFIASFCDENCRRVIVGTRRKEFPVLPLPLGEDVKKRAATRSSERMTRMFFFHLSSRFFASKLFSFSLFVLCFLPTQFAS